MAAPTGTLAATLTGGALTVTDIDATGKDNVFSISVSGSNLVISDANEPFTAASATDTGGTLSNGNKTLTIPLLNKTSLTVSGVGGNDTFAVGALGTLPR